MFFRVLGRDSYLGLRVCDVVCGVLLLSWDSALVIGGKRRFSAAEAALSPFVNYGFSLSG